jgi:uncharacterized protein (DUF697 family)
MAKSLPKMTDRTLEDIKATAAPASSDDAKSASDKLKARAKPKSGNSQTTDQVTLDPVLGAALTRRAEEEGRSVEDLLTEAAIPRETYGKRLLRARGLVTQYAAWNGIAGAVPLPTIDILLVSAVQLAMVRALAKLYGVAFQDDLGKALILSALGSVTPYMLSWNLLGSVVKFGSPTGLAASMFSMSALSGASTYAMGRLFIQHFESGGTLLTMDPQETKNYFRKLFLEEQRAWRKKSGRP